MRLWSCTTLRNQILRHRFAIPGLGGLSAPSNTRAGNSLRAVAAHSAASGGVHGELAATVRVRTCAYRMRNSLVRKPGAGKLHARFDERGVETEHGEASEAPADERAGKPIGQALNYRATPRLY